METFHTMNALSKQHQNDYLQQMILSLPASCVQLYSNNSPHQQLVLSLQHISKGNCSSDQL